MAPPGKYFEPYWGEKTANIDWCEENYLVSPYFAEFWNTFSSLVIIIPNIICAFAARKVDLELRYFLLNLEMICVGVGTWLFHMTLHYNMQLLDELPLLFTSASIIVCFWDINGLPKRYNWKVFAFIYLYSVSATVLYLILDFSLLFQFLYIFMMVIMFGIILRMAILAPCARQLVINGMVSMSLAIFFWLSDMNLCPQIEALRNEFQWLQAAHFRPLTEFHALWHFFSGLGFYFFYFASVVARAEHLKRDSHVDYLFGFVPYLTQHSTEAWSKVMKNNNYIS